MRWVALLAVTACSFEPGRGPRDGGGTSDGGDRDAMQDGAVGCRATAVAASGGHTCAVRNDGQVRCWGRNAQGEIGRAPTTSAVCTVSTYDYPCEKAPLDPMVPVAVTALGLGDQHSCAIGGGKVYCWGADDAGQFGAGQVGDKYAPYEVTARAGATTVVGGYVHTCSLANGSASCSGGNYEGEVGDGSGTMVFNPVVAKTDVVALGTGYIDVYVVVGGNDVWGWGDNSHRQIDSSGTDPRTTPIHITGITGATAVTGGTWHACAVLANQTAVCWGANDDGQLGRGTMTSLETPGTVTIATSVRQVSAGGNHTCVLRDDKTVVCAGEGYGAGGVTLALAGPAAQVTSGSYHDCAVLEDGTVWCWGWNAYGQLGDGSTNNSTDNTPHQVAVCP